jgi:hypothetical protein
MHYKIGGFTLNCFFFYTIKYFPMGMPAFIKDKQTVEKTLNLPKTSQSRKLFITSFIANKQIDKLPLY